VAEQKAGRLLNPFAFPSETQLRSVLLIWAILGLCWLVGFSFAKALLDTRGWPAVGELPSLDSGNAAALLENLRAANQLLSRQAVTLTLTLICLVTSGTGTILRLKR
jgi:hypothetical protein